ncbi:TPA: hypothetical protein HA253_06170 [Candidatus Woesearchaeota archaeon]|nr:hypothetical protein [Candidatus Woesearchaeota archaeon]
MTKEHRCGYLNPKALALALGGVWGAYVFLLGLILATAPGAKFFWVSKEFLGILATLYPGYAPTIQGSFIGLFWAFICGAVGGAVVAWLHNLALEKTCK